MNVKSFASLILFKPSQPFWSRHFHCPRFTSEEVKTQDINNTPKITELVAESDKDPLGKTLMLGKIEGKRRRGQQRMRWLDGITDSEDMDFSEFWEMVRDREAWHVAVYGVTKSQIWLCNWTTTVLNVNIAQSPAWRLPREPTSFFWLRLWLVILNPLFVFPLSK